MAGRTSWDDLLVWESVSVPGNDRPEQEKKQGEVTGMTSPCRGKATRYFAAGAASAGAAFC